MDEINSFGHGNFGIIAGPCSIEDYDSLYQSAKILKEMGIKYLRGGAYKLRTSVHSFRGLGDSGILHLARVGQELGLKTVSECTQIDKVDFMAKNIDVLVVGTRNMQNYPLLELLGKIDKPVILKRGMAATYDEWMAAAEYIIENGNEQVILCERGIRTFETETRYTLDLSAIKVMQQKCGIPVIIDPSHAAGNRALVPSLAMASIAGGADGLMIECCVNPCESICDADQTIEPETLRSIINAVVDLRQHLNRI
ncbi:MAG: 3-deoxy-7-phosphoheptulonate synthase [Candidatus Cloacimonetes bacterium]|nr:3-deoxy-7-phosphoheptulonate synthase [Candidatus Cloacimonadota bacterium]MDD2506608.1 3-deoxy-7-phosphoheptulonate synthase [Candidatus Cloacimonadota bacterium]MDD4560227.1 3-deoxy-7-phosphoheptulonate synthase [Candidatus Cloacimonadota bacterium]